MSLDERIKYASMKARHKKKLEPWYQKWWGKIMIVLGFLLAILLIASSLYIMDEVQKIRNGQSAKYLAEQTDLYLEAINRPSANTYGPSNAPVTIVEFSDFACPFCRDSFAGLKNIREKYQGQVRIVYRDYPLHSNSIILALSARCAGEQGKFWLMHDLFFENQDRFNVSQDELLAVMPEIAELLQIEPIQFKSCLDSQRHFSQLEQDYQDGSFLNIEGTPTWFINNSRFTGHIPAQNLEELVAGLINLRK